MARPCLPAALTEGRAARGRRLLAAGTAGVLGALKGLSRNPSTWPCRASCPRADGGVAVVSTHTHTKPPMDCARVSVGRGETQRQQALCAAASTRYHFLCHTCTVYCVVYDVTRSTPHTPSSTCVKLFFLEPCRCPSHWPLAASTHLTLYHYLDLSISHTSRR